MSADTRVLQVGIRGAGQIAYDYARVIHHHPKLSLAAICSRSEDRAQHLAAHYNPQTKIFTRYQDMLDDTAIDVIVICTPNSFHAGEAIQAFEAKKHLILETPIAITYHELRNLRAAAIKSETRSVASFVLRWHPLVRNVKTLLHTDPLGKIYYAEADYAYDIQPNNPNYHWIQQKEFSGGAMLAGCHAADLLRYLSGKEVDEVFAYCFKARQDFNYGTTLVASVKFVDGTIGKISVLLDELKIPYEFEILLRGTEGMVKQNQLYSKGLLPEQIEYASLSPASQNTLSAIQQAFQQEIDEFAAHLLNRTPICSDVLDACNSLEIALAIEESAMIAKPVKIIGM